MSLPRASRRLVLLTGGMGFIGSHTCITLLEAGYDCLILDNLCNSRAEVLDKIEHITGIRPTFIRGDIRDQDCLNAIFASHDIFAVLHFAGLKAVGESVRKPLEYFDTNVAGTLNLLSCMRESSTRTIVFSSSATVYGNQETNPIPETAARAALNPYGRSKLMVEDILEDLFHSDSGWRIARLRYFNPAGAHPSGLLGENPLDTPNNLMPYLLQVASGQLPELNVFGGDYPTIDGTGVRDYIHVVDLAEAHVAALNHLATAEGMVTLNLGTGIGISVLQMIEAFEQASGCTIPYRIVERRAGDVAACWNDTRAAREVLGWAASRTLRDICLDSWRWQSTSKDCA